MYEMSARMYFCSTTRSILPLLRHLKHTGPHSSPVLMSLIITSPLLLPSTALATFLLPTSPPKKAHAEAQGSGSHPKSLPQPWSTCPDTHNPPAPKLQLRPSMPTPPRAPQTPSGHDWAHICPQTCSSSSSVFSISVCGSTQSPCPETWSHPQHLPVPHSPTADQSRVLSTLPSAF